MSKAAARSSDCKCTYCDAPARSFWRALTRWKKCDNGHKFVLKMDSRKRTTR